MPKNVLILFLLAVALFTANLSMAADAGKEKEAVASAEKWLDLVDDGKYAESWQQAAQYFKTAVSETQWENSLQGVRKPLGKLISRKVARKTYQTSLPGAPDGEYVVIQFQTSFQHKKSAVETVTPMKDSDGKWRIAGYYIK